MNPDDMSKEELNDLLKYLDEHTNQNCELSRLEHWPCKWAIPSVASPPDSNLTCPKTCDHFQKRIKRNVAMAGTVHVKADAIMQGGLGAIKKKERNDTEQENKIAKLIGIKIHEEQGLFTVGDIREVRDEIAETIRNSCNLLEKMGCRVGNIVFVREEPTEKKPIGRFVKVDMPLIVE